MLPTKKELHYLWKNTQVKFALQHIVWVWVEVKKYLHTTSLPTYEKFLEYADLDGVKVPNNNFAFDNKEISRTTMNEFLGNMQDQMLAK